MLTLVLVAILCLLLVCIYFWDIFIPDKKFAGIGNQIPGPPAYPIFGNIFSLIGAPCFSTEYWENVHKTYGNVVRFWFGSSLYVLINSPEDLETVLNNTRRKPKEYKFVEGIFGRGLITIDVDLWVKHRKILKKWFHLHTLSQQIHRFVAESEKVMETVEENINCEKFNILPSIRKGSLDIICRSAIGSEVEMVHRKFAMAVKTAGRTICSAALKMLLMPAAIFDVTKDGKVIKSSLGVINQTMLDIIRQKKSLIKEMPEEELEEESTKDDVESVRNAFIDLLLTDDSLSEDEIIQEVQAFIMAGHETTSLALGYSVYNLARHPEIQEKVYEEVTEAMEGNNAITLKTLSKFKLLEQVIKESMRMYTIIPFIGRKLEQDTKLSNGCVLPKGTGIIVNIHGVHRNPVYYPEPDKFNPDRFSPEAMKQRHAFTYLPFAAGPRNCIGSKYAMFEMKTVIGLLIRKFEFIAEENAMKVGRRIFHIPTNGVPVTVALR